MIWCRAIMAKHIGGMLAQKVLPNVNIQHLILYSVEARDT